ncbi:MAG: hypothetical protein GY943_18530 [Chloroflexi bacterium]|nr:hypothetical protein [Chloroflexota bacterium]
MKDIETEQVQSLLQQFISGELSEAEADEVVEMLTSNEQKMDMLDQLWDAQPEEPSGGTRPDLDKETAKRLEYSLVQQIHRSKITGAVLKMGTRGFASVAMGLLRPFARRRPSQARNKRNRR